MVDSFLFEAQTPPGPPQNITLLSDSHHIGVQWSPPVITESYDVINKYVVSWGVLPMTSEVHAVINGNVTVSIISVTEYHGRLFRIRVRAENNAGVGPYSNPKYLRTGKDILILKVATVKPRFNTTSKLRPLHY